MNKPAIIQQCLLQVLTYYWMLTKFIGAYSYMGLIFLLLWTLSSLLSKEEAKWSRIVLTAFPWPFVNMSSSAPSSRLSSFYYLSCIKHDFLKYLWNFSRSHSCFKLTVNFLRCLYYSSLIILTYIPLVSSFSMFSHLLQAPWAAVLISLDTLFSSLSAPSVTVWSEVHFDSFPFLLWHFHFTVIWPPSHSFSKLSVMWFFTSRCFRFCVLFLFLAGSDCGATWLIFPGFLVLFLL